MDCHRNSYLAGDGNCKKLRLGFLMRRGCGSFQRWWMRHRLLLASVGNAKCRAARLSPVPE